MGRGCRQRSPGAHQERRAGAGWRAAARRLPRGTLRGAGATRYTRTRRTPAQRRGGAAPAHLALPRCHLPAYYLPATTTACTPHHLPRCHLTAALRTATHFLAFILLTICSSAGDHRIFSLHRARMLPVASLLSLPYIRQHQHLQHIPTCYIYAFFYTSNISLQHG